MSGIWMAVQYSAHQSNTGPVFIWWSEYLTKFGPVFKWCPLGDRTTFYHLKYRPIWYSDPHCIVETWIPDLSAIIGKCSNVVKWSKFFDWQLKMDPIQHSLNLNIGLVLNRKALNTRMAKFQYSDVSKFCVSGIWTIALFMSPATLEFNSSVQWDCLL